MKIKKSILQCYHYLQNHLQALQHNLIILSVLTLLFCRQISGYFSNYDANYWFDYFIITERLSMLFLALSAYKYLNKKFWLAIELLIFFLTQDFIDRVFFDIRVWSINDTVIIGFIILQYTIRKFKNGRTAKHI